MWPIEMKGTKRNQELKQSNPNPGLQGHTKRSREPALKQESSCEHSSPAAYRTEARVIIGDSKGESFLDTPTAPYSPALPADS